MLFILAMDPLQKILDKATAASILSPLPTRAAALRAIFYADDAALFVNPVHEEIVALHRILLAFGSASDLRINEDKCVAYPIHCQQIDIADMLGGFGGSLGSFPCQYLGLPLSTRKLRRIDMQPMIDKGAARLKIWKGRLMNKTGRLQLINSTLTATATFFLTSFAPHKWAVKKFDRLRRNFLWKWRRKLMVENVL
ncbi:uncharacterized protein [Aegilops tauschii subsp. strangulata]|uniref:uncharacterized protein n=1 Tax=Aegilops tauschii subsp. strangulata TaxID=200361 RepID=UPI003CC85DA6